VKDVDTELRDQPQERFGVAPDDQRIFGRERQGQVASSCSRKVALQRAAAGADKRSPSGRRKRSRQFDGAALRPAGDETRDYL
jgi:hypothetical protein